jgi:hypothetical protein
MCKMLFTKMIKTSLINCYQLKDNRFELGKNKRVKIIKIFGLGFLIYLLENKPRIYFEVISCTKTSYCRKAVDNEIEFIMNNHTWKLVDLSPKINH